MNSIFCLYNSSTAGKIVNTYTLRQGTPLIYNLSKNGKIPASCTQELLQILFTVVLQAALRPWDFITIGYDALVKSHIYGLVVAVYAHGEIDANN